MARPKALQVLHISAILLSVLARLPVWALTNALPAWRPRRTWSLRRAVLVHAIRAASYAIMDPLNRELWLSPSLEECARDARKLGFVWVEPIPDEYVVGEVREMAEVNGVKPERIGGFWYGPRGEDGNPGQRAAPGERVVCHFHGGAHTSGSGHPKSALGVQDLVSGYLEHFGPKYRVFLPEYRLASATPAEPANPFPSSLLDAIAGYRYLIQEVGFEPQNIIIAGDSAGGGIALNLIRYLALANIPSLPVPGGAMLLCPTMDWAKTHTGPDAAMTRNYSSDYVQAVVDPDYTGRALLGQLPRDKLQTSLWLSPGAVHAEWKPGAFTGLPRTIVVAGGAEYTLDGMRVIRDRLAKDLAEGKFTYIEVPDAAHDFFLMTWHEPERTQTLQRLAEWVHD
ncbi:alpha/beta-hydrolase [Lentinus tigrinus ALCF2SS1-7]|uniref:Alpha/beta-hydrolase n=1 Tax=Lentinus tigrinus ALCF2SS1-6 TaxID=1328759 RepID=A0A5C2SBG9_9APHY|nr:alpha/beta-hydrolase [Lentinus tigrinus ALCF2SS1-6]RPD75180.1 alpha/beta-hydrolase [Lentinus tigrinus ALCF2SS1-7]